MVSHCDLIYISLVINDFELSFSSLFAISISGDKSLQIFAHLKKD